MSALRPCTEMQTESSREFLKSCDMSHSVVIASISDVLIPECIMIIILFYEATPLSRAVAGRVLCDWWRAGL